MYSTSLQIRKWQTIYRLKNASLGNALIEGSFLRCSYDSSKALIGKGRLNILRVRWHHQECTDDTGIIDTKYVEQKTWSQLHQIYRQRKGCRGFLKEMFKRFLRGFSNHQLIHQCVEYTKKLGCKLTLCGRLYTGVV